MIEKNSLTKTKAQLELLGNPRIIIQLKDGGKLKGRVEKFTNFTIYIKDKNGDVLDVPRRIISRALLLIDGGKARESAA